MSARWSAGFVFGLSMVFGCVAEVRTFDDDGDGGSGASGGNGGTGGVGGSCAAYLDEASADTVTVRVVNDSGLDVYVPANCGKPSYLIAPDGGDDGQLSYVFNTACSLTCERAISGEQFGCAGAACAPSTFRVPVGQTLDIVWPGTALEDLAMPLACWADPANAGTCEHTIVAPANTYQAVVQGFMSCSDGGTEACACDETTGQCFGEATGIEAYADEATFSFPGDDVVEVVFGVCAFGCADG